MKINDQPSRTPADLAIGGGTVRRRPEGRPAAGEPTGAPTPAATVELSARSRELADALRLAHAAGDVRGDVVRDVRERLDAGTYQVDAVRIARAMLDRRA